MKLYLYAVLTLSATLPMLGCRTADYWSARRLYVIKQIVEWILTAYTREAPFVPQTYQST